MFPGEVPWAGSTWHWAPFVFQEHSGIPKQMQQEKPIPITRKGLEKLQAELDRLRNVDRMAVADRIRTAKEFGDISENSEYDDAKNAQGWVEGRILTLEKMI